MLKSKTEKSKGFTLVELIVSVAITAILMVGISVFFSSSFQNLLAAQQKLDRAQGELVLSSILTKKFNRADQLLEMGDDFAVLRTDASKENKPFMYVGKKEDQLVLKDFLIFNGRESDVSTFSDVNNVDQPSGITKMDGQYFVIAPLENVIYRCSSLPGDCESKLDTTTLDLPVDIATDGTRLYVTDAGSGRVLSINPDQPNEVDEVLSGLNYPTGIEYYEAGENAYLFVSESRNHQVKRIDLNTSEVEVVVGAGSQAACNHSALLCQLNFPMGLAVGDDGNGEGLFIADTGGGRVLKMSDPIFEPSQQDIGFTLNGATPISRIDFIFPPEVMVDTVTESQGNTLHKGKYAENESVLSFLLKSQAKSTHLKEECDEEDNCTSFFAGFHVDAEQHIFEVGDDILFDGKAFKVSNVSLQAEGWRIEVLPDNLQFEPDLEEPISITNAFSGNHTFSFDLSGIEWPPGYHSISAKVYDDENQIVNDPLLEKYILHVGNGELGGSEDLIEVISQELPYPTDLSFSGNNLEISDAAEYTTDFAEPDYRSDFEVTTLDFSTKNEGQLLEMRLVKNEEGELKESIFNAALTD